MKRLASIAVMLFAAAGALAQGTTVDEIKAPPLRKFSMPQPKRIALPNGMVIFILEDRELPLVRGTAVVRGGSRDVPAAKAGLLTIYTQAWRTGGTTTHTGDKLDEMLEARAARLETTGDEDSTAVSMDVLKGDFETVFPLFIDLLRNPAFREDKIDLAKTQANTGISRRNDEPSGILAREAAKLGYGGSSPYTRQAEYATIASITRDDLLDFHKRTVHPNNIILSFIGDFDSAAMERRLRTAFASWTRGPQVAKPDPGIAPAKPGIYFVSKDDVTQASISMVHPGIERSNPDYPAVAVMNEIFSGGFSGRLMQTLRSQRGLTYGVGGGIGANWDYPGLVRVQMSTKSGTTLESIDALRGEIRRMIEAPPTAEEMSLAKESILNAFVFTMDTRQKALNQQVLLEFYGFPADYFTRYPTLLEKVTAEDVARVAKTYIHPDRLAVLVVGNEKEFEKPLSTLGTVTPVDIAIPPLDAGSAQAAPAGSNPEGLALVQKVRDFIGGAPAINAVNVSRTTATMTMNTPQGAMTAEATTIVQYPSSTRQEMKLPMGTMTSVITPETAFVITPMGTQDLPSSRREAAVSDMRTDFMHILRNLDNPKYAFSAAGTEKIGDVETRVVEISADGGRVRWFVEPATGRLVRTIRQTAGSGPAENITDYSEWKRFGALNVPTVATVTRNGERAAEIRVTAVETNPTLDASTFTKP